MHLIALCRWGVPLESELPWLSQQLGMLAYDLRLRIAGAPPVVLKTTPDAAQAESLAALLRNRGHGVVTCDSASVPTVELVARDIDFGATALTGKDATGRAFELPYVDIRALIRASEISVAQQTTTTVKKKLAVGRALMSGGLMMSKKVETSHTHESEEREQVLYAFVRGRVGPVSFRETELRYQTLGAQLKPSTLQNFATFVDVLRARAPQALYDARFLTQKRKAGSLTMAGVSSADRRVESSNVSENELAAYLLALAHEQGQV